MNIKKMLSILLAMVLMFTMSVSAMAQENMEIVRTENIGHLAGCNHNWSSWSKFTEYTEPDLSLDGCITFIREDYRFCKLCNETQIRETRDEKSHNWVTTSSTTQKCSYCKKVIVAVR